MPFIIPQILVQDPCCKFNDCLKILNQKYEEAKCDGCLEVDYAQEKRDLDRYIELEKMLNIAASCGDDSIALEYSTEQETICNGYTLSPKIYGCTDDTADNYDSTATTDNGSCFWTGCMDINACNYNSLATIDDGRCCRESICVGDTYWDCDRCGCEPCLVSGDIGWDASGLHACCPGGANYPCDPVINP